eukprot:CAMPEP_0204385298 /NCGR_PEP_ID=MMETSP0469-20131031/57591_1 /ASSEMBLY_ACC=CAM_ASM_000384 /TAXON_ID=2969 /ORGANISM="Oxyrrhis marina" /LENGTH=54 /DNA_ID=CAMNT_0051378195 /DNA_START=65 /DNA_END=225 /DNA_ORIENTATION=+
MTTPRAQNATGPTSCGPLRQRHIWPCTASPCTMGRKGTPNATHTDPQPDHSADT